MNVRTTQLDYDFADCRSTKKKAVLVNYRKSLRTDRALLKRATNDGAVKCGTFTDRWRTYLVILFKTVKAARLFSSALTRSNACGDLTTAGV
jgi:hypothetical protein